MTGKPNAPGNRPRASRDFRGGGTHDADSFPRLHPQRVTRTQAEAALTALLVCRDRLDDLTPETLARTYRVPPKRIAEMLGAERVRRTSR